jgi:hypothetical protein
MFHRDNLPGPDQFELNHVVPARLSGNGDVSSLAFQRYVSQRSGATPICARADASRFAARDRLVSLFAVGLLVLPKHPENLLKKLFGSKHHMKPALATCSWLPARESPALAFGARRPQAHRRA